MPEGSCEGGALRWKEKNSAKGKDEGSPGFYLLYCLPRLAAESLDDQELEGVIHETVLHIERQTLRVYVCTCVYAHYAYAYFNSPASESRAPRRRGMSTRVVIREGTCPARLASAGPL